MGVDNRLSFMGAEAAESKNVYMPDNVPAEIEPLIAYYNARVGFAEAINEIYDLDGCYEAVGKWGSFTLFPGTGGDGGRIEYRGQLTSDRYLNEFVGRLGRANILLTAYPGNGKDIGPKFAVEVWQVDDYGQKLVARFSSAGEKIIEVEIKRLGVLVNILDCSAYQLINQGFVDMVRWVGGLVEEMKVSSRQ